MAVKVGSRKAPDPDTQVVEILVDNGYHPSLVEVAADMPVRLVFQRMDAHECSDRVVFSEPRLIRHLAPGADTVVDLPAAGPGEVRFTCGMGRYRGRIERRDEPGHGGGARRGAWPWVLVAIVLAALLVLLAIVNDAPSVATWLAITATSLAVAAILLRALDLLPGANGRR